MVGWLGHTGGQGEAGVERRLIQHTTLILCLPPSMPLLDSLLLPPASRLLQSIKEKQVFERVEVTRGEALSMFAENKFKVGGGVGCWACWACCGVCCACCGVCCAPVC